MYRHQFVQVIPGSSLYFATLAVVTFMAFVAARCATLRMVAMTSLRRLRPIPSEKPLPSSECVLSAVSNALVLDRRPSSSRPFLVSSWSSRTASLYRIRLNRHGSADLVAKVLKDAGEVAALVSALNELADTLSNEYPGEFLPVSAVGFDDTVSGVIMPFVDGSSLEQILKRENVGSDFSREAIIALITRAGRLLGRYHWRHADLSPAMNNEAWDDLEFRIKAVFGPTAAARSMVNPSMVSRSLGDFHPGHLLAVSDGRVALIDPASATQYRFVGRDIALFIDRMIMDVLSPRSVLHAPRQTLSYGELSTAFIRGYTEGCGVALTREDRIAIDIYLAFLIKKRLRWVMGGQWAALLYYGVTLVYRYRRAMKRLGATVPNFAQ